jgi:tetratricopeptide (TPR) repeat protein
MKRSSSDTLPRIVSVALLLTFGAAPGSGTEPGQTGPAPGTPPGPRGAIVGSDVEEQAKQLVVMIRGTIAGESVVGAGLIFNVSQNRIYIATANHVVRRGRATDAQTIEKPEVQLWSLRGEWTAAQVLENFDADLDVAVMTVRDPRGLLSAPPPFARLGGRPAQRKDPVYAVGFPVSRPWESNVTPDAIARVDTTTIEFQTSFVQQGHSGGALVNGNWEIIGLIKQDQQPYAVAVRIETVMDKLKNWGYTVALSPAPAPAAGDGSPPAGASGLVSNRGSAAAGREAGIAEIRRMHDLDDWGGSLPLLNRLIADQPKSADLLALRSHAYSHLDRPTEALADGESAVRAGPTVAEAYLRRGEAYSTQGKHQLAIADYDHAIKLKPTEAEAHANRAVALANAGQHQKGLESANKALSISADRYEYWLARAEIQAALKNFTASIDDLTQAIKLQPQRAMLYRERANAYVGAKMVQQALLDLNEALRLEPDEPDTLGSRGIVYSLVGNRDAAKADLSYALRLRPGQKDWQTLLQRLEAEGPSTAGSVGVSTPSGPASAPPPAGGYARLVDDALAAVRAQRTAEATELVDQMIRLDASRSEAWTLRGSLAINAFGNLSAAYEAYENALARGGPAYFRLAHDHGMDQQPCLGTLTITRALVEYEGDTGGHRYQWPYTAIQEAAINEFYGSALGMFHIKAQAPGGRSQTFNFASIRASDQQIINRRPDAEMLLGFINRQRVAR